MVFIIIYHCDLNTDFSVFSKRGFLMRKNQNGGSFLAKLQNWLSDKIGKTTGGVIP